VIHKNNLAIAHSRTCISAYSRDTRECAIEKLGVNKSYQVYEQVRIIFYHKEEFKKKVFTNTIYAVI